MHIFNRVQILQSVSSRPVIILMQYVPLLGPFIQMNCQNWMAEPPFSKGGLHAQYPYPHACMLSSTLPIRVRLIRNTR
jgi:hypothetical protein